VLGSRIFEIPWWGWLLIAGGVAGLGWLGRAVLWRQGGERRAPR
jgi:hypothetical protein